MSEDLNDQPGEGAEPLDTGVTPENDAPAADLPDPDNPDTPGDDDGEDVEYEGQNYRVPKALKDALLRQADYTRKTQEIAETRKQLDESRQAVEQQRTRDQALISEKAKLEAVNQRLAQYDAVNWQELEAYDQANGANHTNRVFREQQQLRQEQQKLAGEVSQKEQEHAFELQRSRAKQLEDGNRVLTEKIPNWGPQVASDISAFVQSKYGLTPEEVGQVVDPRWVMVAHDAMVRDKAAQQQKAVQRHQASQQVRPAATTAQRATAAKDPDRMTSDEWLKWRNASLAQKQG